MEQCLKQQANKKDNFPSSNLPLLTAVGRLWQEAIWQKAKPFFAGSQYEDDKTKYNIVEFHLRDKDLIAYFP